MEARLGELGEGEEEAGPEDRSVGLLWARRERGRGVPEGQPGVSPGRALLRGLKVRHLEAGGTLIFLGRGQSVEEPPRHQCPVRWSQAAGAAAACGAGAGRGPPLDTAGCWLGRVFFLTRVQRVPACVHVCL